ncbi:MAG: hypothetical protein ABJA02_09950 [Acidobacteriota bacterium]
MISGFNTDIEFEDVVYHVQTEDKGLSAKKVISLVYVGGTILASKRSPYDDLVAAGFDENVLAERLQKQHRLICAAIKAGRIDDLKEMTAKASAARSASAAHAVAETVSAPISLPQTVEPTELATAAAGAELFDQPRTPFAPTEPIQQPFVPEPFVFPQITEPELELDIDLFADAPIIEDVSVIEEIFVLPDDAVAVISELSGRERPSNAKLDVELLGDFKFKGGDRLTVHIMVCRGTERKVVTGAQILIKVLGSTFRPVIFHAKSDSNGLAQVHLQLPHFQAGRAALLIRALDGGEEIELRRVVTPG